MPRMETIKQKLKEMEPGAFQNMCNAILSKEGYGPIVAYGSQAGTQKTTPGTPDAYFVTKDQRYIFAEYTTAADAIARKIRADIEKCLDVEKTKMPLDKIAEIIYCHLSSNLAPGDDRALHELCESKGITLTLYGIDQIALKLHWYHREIAQEYLGVTIGTGQIKEVQQFIKDYDANTLSAPLDTQFFGREKEMKQLDQAFQSAKVIVLTGRAGVGKSRLALHFAQMHARKHQERLYCIRSNAQPLYEDLIQHINVPGDYFLLVDDANELSSSLRHILEYAVGRDPQYNVRVLITVRDYAVKSVEAIAKPLVHYARVDVPTFSDTQIKELVETNEGITNPSYQDHIAWIAAGNARIAMLAGRIAKNNGSSAIHQRSTNTVCGLL